ncbi:MAG TPA: helix-hairpin-helix domain-containing protein [Gemmatimonadales bacterium]|nr:helix-hairpin-helix domain-containing protein [Gemmatimonadales bacterium]
MTGSASPADLYDLDADRLSKLEGLAEQSARALVEAIDQSRQRPLRSLLAALGIRHVGGTAAKLLARKLGTLERVRGTSLEEFTALEGIGPTTAASLVGYFGDPASADLLDRLAARGVALSEGQAARTGDQPLAGKTYVLTGTLPTLTRTAATALIEAAGGTVKSSVSKKTDAVVAGTEAGDKLAKATALGVEVIDEAELLRRTGTAT